jgi:VanZ family protein
LKKNIFALPVIVLSLIIVLLSNQATFVLPNLNIVNFDKFVHLIAYGVYSLTVQFAFLGIAKNPTKIKNITFTLLISVLFAASDEIHQYFVPGRQCDIFDFLADTVGIILGLFLTAQILKFVNYIKNR